MAVNASVLERPLALRDEQARADRLDALKEVNDRLPAEREEGRAREGDGNEQAKSRAPSVLLLAALLKELASKFRFFLFYSNKRQRLITSV